MADPRMDADNLDACNASLNDGKQLWNSSSSPRAWRDVFWAVLFWCHMAVVVGVGVWAISHYGLHTVLNSASEPSAPPPASTSHSHSYSPNPLPTPTPFNLYRLLVILFTSSIVLCFVFLRVLQSFAASLVWFCLVFNVVATFSLAFFCALTAAFVPALVLLVFGALQLLYVFFVRSRIAFAAAMLSMVSEVVSYYPSVIAVCLFGVVLQACWVFGWIVCSAGIIYLQRASRNDSWLGLTYFLLTVSLMWTAIVITNVVHVTVAGVVATWYYLVPNPNIKNPTLGSLRRALTWSFGSICLGSLIVAVIKAVRLLVQQATKTDNECVRAIVLCIIDFLDAAVEFFNVYAYSYCAIYGCHYTQAASEAWQLIQSRGISALINDDLSGTVLAFGALIGACIIACESAVLANFVFSFSQNWQYFLLLGAVIGFVTMVAALEVISSGISCLFVCYADDARALQITKPASFERLRSAFYNAPSYNEERPLLGTRV